MSPQCVANAACDPCTYTSPWLPLLFAPFVAYGILIEDMRREATAKKGYRG